MLNARSPIIKVIMESEKVKMKMKKGNGRKEETLNFPFVPSRSRSSASSLTDRDPRMNALHVWTTTKTTAMRLPTTRLQLHHRRRCADDDEAVRTTSSAKVFAIPACAATARWRPGLSRRRRRRRVSKLSAGSRPERAPLMAGEAAALEASTLDKPQLREAAVDEETRALIFPDPTDLPALPTSAVEANFARYFVADFLNPGHDQYVYRHPNGLCVVGLAPAHAAFKEEGGITSVDFNVGKSDRSEMKVTGKRKRNAQHLQENSALCKVFVNDKSFIVRCCVKGLLLEINDRLIKQPNLLNTSADREGYIAIFQPKPADWLKIKDKFLSYDDYKKLRGVC